MSFLDRLLGREQRSPYPPQDRAHESRPDYGTPPSGGYGRDGQGAVGAPTDDTAAVERYRYLLRTAPPDAIEQAHREAFSQLTPEQRRQVLTDLSSEVPESERATSDDPKSLARMATRAEMRRPGTLERSFGGGGMGGGMGMGGLIAGSLLASVAGAFVGTAIADAMFDASDSGGGESADGGDSGGDGGGADSGDSGGGFDSAGDFGGGDFGDFGGGDF